jgi:hypothetical protein
MTSEMEAAGIAPASQIPQVGSANETCVKQGCQWLHYVCTDAALRELVAAWHGLAPEVRDAIVRMSGGQTVLPGRGLFPLEKAMTT